MGRYDFKAQRVHQAASQLLRTGRILSAPPWHEIVYTVPPPEILTRPVLRRGPRDRRASKMFQPVTLKYEEDSLRQEFFNDHPWELARPRIVLEDGGNDSKQWDWSRIKQPGKKLDGESVIQRQKWLIRNTTLTKSQAYDKARKEFYGLRQMEDIERRVAQEEALSTGAYFGKSALEVGSELEDRWYEDWRSWAGKQITLNKHEEAASSPTSIAGLETTLGDDLEDAATGATEALEAEEAIAEEVTVPA